ncbi:hypothetical protein GF324_05680, partial [bacterium]|nr:hypothetical protein [bacterium]
MRRSLFVTLLLLLAPLCLFAQTWESHFISENEIGSGAPHTITVDFDGDGDDDLVYWAWHYLGWFENETVGSDFSLTHRSEIDADYALEKVQVGDVDGDGDYDLIALNENGWMQCWENNNGQGTSWNELEGIFPNNGYIRDFFAGYVPYGSQTNNDLDFIIARESNANNYHGTAVWYGYSTQLGFYEEFIDTDYYPNAVDLADIDSDGRSEVITASGNGIRYHQEESGFFGFYWAHYVISTDYASAFTIEDFDNDGDLDVIGATSSTLKWYRNNLDSASGFMTITIPETISGIVSVRTGDLNNSEGGGLVDILVTTATGFHDEDLDLYAFYNINNGYDWTQEHVSNYVIDGNVINANNDGYPDIVGGVLTPGDPDLILIEQVLARMAVEEETVDLYWDNLGPAPSTQITVSNAGRFTLNWEAQETIDWLFVNPVNGSIGEDESEEVTVTMENFPGVGTHTGTVYFEDPNLPHHNIDSLVVNLHTTESTPWDEHVVDGGFSGGTKLNATDLDGDGDLDAIGLAGDTGTLTWWENTDGSGTSYTEHTIDNSATGLTSLHAADFDGDGDQDLLSAKPTTNTISWWENTDGTGLNRTTHTVDAAVSSVQSVYPADLDGDNQMDVVGASPDDDLLLWWKNDNGTGLTWTEALIYQGLAGITHVEAADIDVDGDTDVLVVSPGQNTLVWFSNLDGTGSSWNYYTVDAEFEGATYATALQKNTYNLEIYAVSSTTGEVAWYNGSHGTWGKHIIDESFPGASVVQAMDMDDDDDVDVIALGDNIGWWEDRVTETLQRVWVEKSVDNTFNDPRDMLLANMDGDGDNDIFAISYTDGLSWWEQPGGSTPFLSVEPTSLEMEWDGSGPAPSASFTITNEGGGTLEWSTSENVAWLSVSPLSGSLGPWQSTDVTVSAEEYPGLGVFTASLDISAPGAVPDNATVDVSLTGSWSKTIIPFESIGITNVSAADVDGDGDRDFFAATPSEDEILWFENLDGSGTSWTEHTIATAFDYASYVEAVDMDHDGDMDVVGAGSNSNKIAWWENTDGSGTSWTYELIDSLFTYPRELSLADIDNNGYLDVLVAGNGGVAYWPTSGYSGPGARTTVYTNAAYSAAGGDVDGDTYRDIVVVPQSGSVMWYEYIYSWSAQQGFYYNGKNVALADVNGDGHNDVVVAGGNDIVWRENDGGNPVQWTQHTIGSASYWQIEMVDIDGDADLDIVGRSLTDQYVSWWENTDGMGTSWEETTFLPEWNGAHIEVADMDGDVDKDILGVKTSGGSEIAWWEQPGEPGPAFLVSPLTVDLSWTDGQAAPEATITLSNTGGGSYDWTATETLDWLSLSAESGTMGPGSSEEITLTAENFPGHGFYSGTIELSAPGAEPNSASVNVTLDAIEYWISHNVDMSYSFAYTGGYRAQAVDMDGDGDRDMLCPTTWWENTDGTGETWTEHTITSAANFAHAVDIDGDGDMDVVRTAGNTTEWWENTDGSATSWTSHSITSTFGAYAVGDVDGDGDPDLVGRLLSSAKWFENDDGTGSTWTEHSIGNCYSGTTRFTVIDEDGDGDLDILMETYADRIEWYINEDGAGTSWTQEIVANHHDLKGFHAGDIDGDGDIDVVALEEGGQAGSFPYYYTIDPKIVWYERSLGPNWQRQTITSSYDDLYSVHIVDMDQDGDGDVLSASGSSEFFWWENTDGAGAGWEPTSLGISSPNARFVTAADVNSDGHYDAIGTGTQGRVMWREQPGADLPPVLELDPAAVEWVWLESDDAPTAKITVSNAGGGNLTWSVSGSIPWLTAQSEGGTLNSLESTTITLTAENYPGEGTYTGT